MAVLLGRWAFDIREFWIVRARMLNMLITLKSAVLGILRSAVLCIKARPKAMLPTMALKGIRML